MGPRGTRAGAASAYLAVAQGRGRGHGAGSVSGARAARAAAGFRVRAGSRAPGARRGCPRSPLAHWSASDTPTSPGRVPRADPSGSLLRGCGNPSRLEASSFGVRPRLSHQTGSLGRKGQRAGREVPPCGDPLGGDCSVPSEAEEPWDSGRFQALRVPLGSRARVHTFTEVILTCGRALPCTLSRTEVGVVGRKSVFETKKM